MPRINDILAVHGVGEQRRTDTLSTFAKHFYKGVRKAALDAGQDPNREVKLIGRYHENCVEVHYRDEEVFRLWEISWERSFQVPSSGQVLTWLWQWSDLYFNWARAQLTGQETQHRGRAPLPKRTMLLLFVLLDLTFFIPLIAVGIWLWAAERQVRYQKANDDQMDKRLLIQHRAATGLALVLSTPLIIGLQLLTRLGRAGANLPVVGSLFGGLAQRIDHLVVGSLGDGMLYIFDAVQAAFIRGELEKIITRIHDEAIEQKRDPLIHIIGHSLGSVIAYETVSYSLDPDLRPSVKTLCTMGTVLDMIRHVLESEGLVLEEQVRFCQDIPKGGQGAAYPHWMNLFARNDPATGFGSLLKFGQDPANQPVGSTSKGHSTYWTDVNGVHRPFLAQVAHDNPVLARPPSLPDLEEQTGLWTDVRQSLTKWTVIAVAIVGLVFVGDWWLNADSARIAIEADQLLRDAALPGLVSWLAGALDWLQTNLAAVVTRLPAWYARWLLGLTALFLGWVAFLGLPHLARALLRRWQYRRLVPLEQGAKLNHWIASLKGVGPDHVLALRKKGIWSVHDFLVAVVRSGGPARLAGLLDVPEEQVMRWARQANLMRLRGVGPKRAESLMAAGADSLATLSQLERGALVERLAPTLEQAGLQSMPAGSLVKQWIERAKTLRDVV